MKQNEFELEEKYKLYRTVKDLLHPTISKRNISNYKIVVDEKSINDIDISKKFNYNCRLF